MPPEIFKKILIVDDEENMRHMLSFVLEGEGYGVAAAAGGEEALKMLGADDFQLMLADVRMPGMDGVELLKEALGRRPELTVIMMSAYGTIDSALEAIRLGAYDYISKPFRPEQVVLAVKKAEERLRLIRENEELREQVAQTYTLSGMVGKSPAMRRVFDSIKRVAEVSSTVLITGESGTGKELVARAVHFSGPRAKDPFVAVNCAGIPETLLESELFGHVKGAFTDAIRDKPGLITQAQGGTFFLDEVGDMPPSTQAKLLRVLEDQMVRPVGGTSDTEVDVRFIAATQKDLEKEVEGGRFRRDLFFRLNVVNINLPPLRERPEDLRPLVAHFLKKYSKELGKKVEALSPLALSMLRDYAFPGNIRELENIIESATVMASGEMVEARDLPPRTRAGGHEEPPPDDEGELSLKDAVERLERARIAEALRRTGGNRLQASKLLKISHPTLLSKIKKYEIES